MNTTRQELGYVQAIYNGSNTSARTSSNYGSPQLNNNGRAVCAFVILRLAALSLRANRDVVSCNAAPEYDLPLSLQCSQPVEII